MRVMVRSVRHPGLAGRQTTNLVGLAGTLAEHWRGWTACWPARWRAYGGGCSERIGKLARTPSLARPASTWHSGWGWLAGGRARWRAGSLAGWLAGWQVTGLCYSVQESSRQRFPRGGRLALQLVELRQALRSPIPFDRFPQQRQRHVRPPHLARCTTAQSGTGRRSAAMSGGAGYRSASCCPSSSPSGSGTIDRNPHRHPGFGAAPNARGVVRATRPFADAGWLAGGPPRDSAGWLAGPPTERSRN